MVEWLLLPVFQVCLSRLSSYIALAYVLTWYLRSCFGSLPGQSHCPWLSACIFGDLDLLFSVFFLASWTCVTYKLSSLMFPK